MTPLALFLLSHGARTIPSSRLTKELIHLGYRPVCFTTWYYSSGSYVVALVLLCYTLGRE